MTSRADARGAGKIIIATREVGVKFPQPHPMGHWPRKVNGRTCDFGTDRDALNRSVASEDDLPAGRRSAASVFLRGGAGAGAAGAASNPIECVRFPVRQPLDQVVIRGTAGHRVLLVGG